jgi:hypothetical protein
MDINRWNSIMEKLLNRTINNKLEWKETNNEKMIMVQVGDYYIFLEKAVMEDSYLIILENLEGKRLENFSVDDEYDIFGIVSEVYAAGKRAAAGVDKALKEIEEDLDLPF